jgi:transcriptional regulator with XRE-family HTH domain
MVDHHTHIHVERDAWRLGMEMSRTTQVQLMCREMERWAEVMVAAVMPRIQDGRFVTVSRKRRIRALMALRGLTDQDVAQGLGYTRNAVTRMLNGRNNSKRIAAHLADLLGVPADLLVQPSFATEVSIAPGTAPVNRDESALDGEEEALPQVRDAGCAR